MSKGGLGFNPLDLVVGIGAMAVNVVAPGAGAAVAATYAGLKSATKGTNVTSETKKTIQKMWISLQKDPSWWNKSVNERTAAYWANTLEEMKSEPDSAKNFFMSKMGIDLSNPNNAALYAISQAVASVDMRLASNQIGKIYDDRARLLARSVYGNYAYQCLDGLQGKFLGEKQWLAMYQKTLDCLETRIPDYSNVYRFGTGSEAQDAYVTGYEGQTFQKAPWYRWKYLPHVIGIGVVGLVGYKLLK
jgi:hypothetical protein